MLRRAPTQIQLNAEDIAQFEDNRLARLARQAEAARQGSAGSSETESMETATQKDPSDELKPRHGPKPGQVRYTSLGTQAGNAGAGAQGGGTGARTREERIGL